MLNGIFGIGRAYKKLPPHEDFEGLAKNMDTLASYLKDRAARNYDHINPARCIEDWEGRLGNDLAMLVKIARASIPEDSVGLHHYWPSPRFRD